MRYLATIVIIAFFFSNSYSQVRTSGKAAKDWTFQMGPTVGMIDGKRLAPTTYGLILQPKFIFGQLGRETSVSVSMPLTALMFSQKYGANSIVNSGFSANIPIVLDFNFYHAAFKREKRTLGAYLGAGWNFNYMNFSTYRADPIDITNDVKNNYDGLNHGPYFNAGIRIKIANGASFDIRVYGTMSLARTPLNVYGVGVLYNFGMKAKSYGQGSGWF